jgi:hypothetical protein
MILDATALRFDERAVFALRSLYSAYGYSYYNSNFAHKKP